MSGSTRRGPALAVNLADLLAASAERYAERAAVTDTGSGRCLSYGALGRETERIAAFLAAQGVSAGDRIGLSAPNRLSYLPAAFGVLASGACLVPLAGHLTPSETAELIREVELNGWLAAPGANLLGDARRGAAVSGGACDGFEFHHADRQTAGPAEFRRLNPAFIRFTSGTTAASKGVVLSHEATLARVEAADRVLRFGPDDRILWVLPLAYHFAVTIVAYVRAGSHIVLCPDARPAAMLDAICRLGATVLYASPLHFDRLSHLPSRGQLDSVRLALSTSAPLARAVSERFEARHGVPLGQAYGIIEAGLPAIDPGGGDAPAGSLGRPVPGYEIAILTDGGAPAAPGGIGEIAVRGEGLFSAYYAPWRLRERLTASAGWFLTGDVGSLDPGGALHLTGRKKAVINVAGLKVFPEEVEACLARFPGVAECRVYGRRHDRLGEVPCADVVADPGGCDLDALAAHCARELSSYKVPVAFSAVGAIARTPGGKILRRQGAR